MAAMQTQSHRSTPLGSLALLLSPVRNGWWFVHGLRVLWRNRALCRELLHRDLGSQYAGQALGAFWVIAHPMLLLGIYIFVFAFVFEVRMGGTRELPRDYISYLLAGLVPWLAIQISVARSTVALLGQANLVKQVVFPMEVLPFGSVLVALVPQLVGIAVIFGYTLVKFGSLPWTYLLIPVAVAIEVLFMAGIAFVLAGITPFFRDLKDVVTVLTVAGVYMVPAFYPPGMTAGTLDTILHVNPFSYPIWIFQDVFYYGRIEHPLAWLVASAMAIASFALGYRAFAQVKPYVANVL
jgi:homopolymeric O-antigen transport system permease protein